VIEQYDAIGEAYEGFKTLPMARYPERASFLALLGDVRDRAVLDLACGTGYYTRAIRRLGARPVTGIDVSPEMVRAAQDIERRTHLGITYQVANAAGLPKLGAFSVVSAVYLLNYAADEAQLTSMCEGALRNLADDGQFVTLTQNPDFSFDGPQPAKYGFSFIALASVPIGTRVRITAHLDPPIAFETFVIAAPVYEHALAAAGFTKVEWIPLHVTEGAVESFAPGYWQDFLDNPPLIMLRCRP
jgi:SAM-dependent methyltransferase